MQILTLDIPEVKLISPRVFYDDRGYFFESFQIENLSKKGIDCSFVQDNVSFSKFGVIRGLHFQDDPGQDKLVSCMQGEIWDVAVDLRKDSKTFGKWVFALLSEDNHQMLFIPKGFAHGFCVVSPFAKVHYKVSSLYNPATERSIRWNDPDLNIHWPVENPSLSIRDMQSPFFAEYYSLS